MQNWKIVNKIMEGIQLVSPSPPRVKTSKHFSFINIRKQNSSLAFIYSFKSFFMGEAQLNINCRSSHSSQYVFSRVALVILLIYLLWRSTKSINESAIAVELEGSKFGRGNRTSPSSLIQKGCQPFSYEGMHVSVWKGC